MSNELERRIEDLLKLLADATRRKIIQLISRDPMNPQKLAEKIKISRPAVEKHLKLLLANFICERAVEAFPTPHYVYYISQSGSEMIDAITSAVITFFQSMDGIINAEIDQLERDFVLKAITRAEYDTRKPLLIKKQKELEALQLTRIWVEEAKKLIDEYKEDKI